ncbi:class II aldolase/adducin family protein [Legionella cherrii]|uniref:Aldolase II superfamily protein n=1 Tax=Legionella cherrii TaxID=28084 RepID=A0ABY6T2W5_9GAMM|nr:class II aldolase/adducin family protein [Legionella cherrii]VEB33645.1 aldolase II superfamily protein [Legionella cherrii]
MTTAGVYYKECPRGMTIDEWAARVDLAALYRLVAWKGWDDLIFTHISMRVPGSQHHYLLSPFGLMFEEVTASSLMKVDVEGHVIESESKMINPAAFTIHSAIYKARDDAKCVIHLHTLDGVALSVCAEGLLPLTQNAMIIGGELAYHDYEGIVLDSQEGEKLVADLGSKHLMLLRNHGTLAVGPNCGAAWLLIYYLESACSMQLRATTHSRELNKPIQGIPEKVHKMSRAWYDGTLGTFAWPTFLRKLDRIDPRYRT